MKKLPVTQGQINKKGFVAPEKVVDPDEFIKELSKRKVKVIVNE